MALGRRGWKRAVRLGAPVARLQTVTMRGQVPAIDSRAQRRLQPRLHLGAPLSTRKSARGAARSILRFCGSVHRLGSCSAALPAQQSPRSPSPPSPSAQQQRRRLRARSQPQQAPRQHPRVPQGAAPAPGHTATAAAATACERRLQSRHPAAAAAAAAAGGHVGQGRRAGGQPQGRGQHLQADLGQGGVPGEGGGAGGEGAGVGCGNVLVGGGVEACRRRSSRCGVGAMGRVLAS